MESEMNKYEWLEKAKSLDFDQLENLVSERLRFLRLTVENFDKMNEPDEIKDMICRDLVFPLVMRLAGFIDSVKVRETDKADEDDETAA